MTDINRIDNHRELRSYIQELGLTFEFQYLKSSDQWRDKNWNFQCSLRWNVTISNKDGLKKTFSHTCGTKHLQDMAKKRMPEDQYRKLFTAEIQEAQKTGILETYAPNMTVPIDPPDILDVLYCIVSDAESSFDSFKDFCDNCGFDDDSISHHKIYLLCRKMGRDLISLIGRDALNKLTELFRDY